MNRTSHRSSIGVLLAGALLASATAHAAGTRNILIVRGESADLPGGRIIVDQLETTLRKSSPVPVEFYLETLDTARFSGEQYEQRLADLFVEKYAAVPLDLVVAFSDPAVKFTARVRNTVFPGVPVLFGLVDRRLVDVKTLPSNSSIVFVDTDAAGTARLARELYPRMRRLLVVGGTSQFDRGWQRVVREELAPIGKEIVVEYDVDSPLPVLARRLSSLPPDTAVFYASMTRDAANTPLRPIDALETLRAASPVPIFGLSSTYIGHGAVGGSVLDFNRHGEDLALAAARIIAGDEAPSSTSMSSVMVDWRELQRFGIASESVPAGTIVQFRDPGAWERQRSTVVVASLIVLGETGLIVALVVTGQRRREGQRTLQGRVAFDHLLAELSMAVVAVGPGGIDIALHNALDRMASGLGFDWVWRWKFFGGADTEWDSPFLRAGQAVFFDGITDLPGTIQAKVREAGATQCSAVAVPLAPGGIVVGALFWVARAPVSSWRGRLDELRMVSTTVANVLQRKEAEGALERSDRLKSAILASLPAHVAVLDREGSIIAANDAWAEFGQRNGLACAAGEHGCAACAQAACTGAADALAAIEAVCAGSAGGRQMEYLCAAPDGQRWFLMTAEPLRRTERGAVITHLDITERKTGEIALRESEDRFRRMADALPLAIWMTDLDGGCIYVNQQGLELVGRQLEDEIGLGWLENVHPADRVHCRQVFLAAFRERRGFRSEYRIQTPKGEWRWLMDTGMPRYGSDGAFHGYVGGCIDITDRKQAEDVLHDVNQRLMKAQDDERRRIARELHDHLSQQLALLAIDLQQLGMNPPKTVQAALPTLQEAWRRTTEIASDVHAISHRLHPSKMEALGLVATVKAHCRDVSRQSLAVQFNDENVPRDIAADRALTLFRVLEEALSNVARHSGASSARVTLTGTAAEVLLRVVDDGTGFVSNGKPAGLGLISMRERVESLDGTLSITTVAMKGTVLEARVPLSSMRASVPAGEPAAVPNLHS